MSRYKIKIEYDGSKYKGWQIQSGITTVQGTIIKTCSEIFQHNNFELYGAGRTDAGVHALEQVAHLDVGLTFKPENLKIKLNDALPHSINIIDVQQVDKTFHARHSAIARSYVYLISKRRTGLAKNYVWWIRDLLDIEKINNAAKIFLGLKDYFNFTQIDKNDTKSTKVQVDYCKIIEKDQIIAIHIIGSHFLWHMVRRMVGCLVEIGRNKLTETQLSSYFTQKNEFPAQHTAPPSGLYLEKIYYKGDEINYQPNIFVNLK